MHSLAVLGACINRPVYSTTIRNHSSMCLESQKFVSEILQKFDHVTIPRWVSIFVKYICIYRIALNSSRGDY